MKRHMCGAGCVRVYLCNLNSCKLAFVMVRHMIVLGSVHMYMHIYMHVWPCCRYHSNAKSYVTAWLLGLSCRCRGIHGVTVALHSCSAAAGPCVLAALLRCSLVSQRACMTGVLFEPSN